MIKSSFSTVLALAATLAVSGANAQVAFVNGASFSTGAVAPGAFASVFGQNLCQDSAISQWLGPRQLQTEVAGCSVAVNGEPAMLSFVSPGQINFVVPDDAAAGQAQVAVKSPAGTQTGTMIIAKAGPGVFSMNGMGVGKGAVLHALLGQKGPFSATTDKGATPLSIYMTGLDLSAKPVVTVGGQTVDVLWYGVSPQYAGLQQINVLLPASMAGVGTVPVMITSGAQASNVTFMTLLPTTAMMTMNPHWPIGKVIADNMRRGRETSSIAFLPAGTNPGSVLVADEDDDVVRIVSLSSKETTATITLPEDSEPDHVAVSPDGSLAAAVLPEKASVALINLATKEVSIIGVGNYPMHVAFTPDGNYLLVTNHAGRSVSVIDLKSKLVAQTVVVGSGPAGIAVNGGTALVANMQEGTLTAINITDWTTKTIALPDGSRPFEVAYAGSKAVITMPMTNSCLLYDAANTQNPVTTIDTSAWGAFGPRAIATKDNLVFLANQMSANVAVIDVSLDKPAVIKTFPVDPGPRALAVAGNQLLVLSQAVGVIDVVDLSSYSIVSRIDSIETDRDGAWKLPVVLSLSPATGTQGDTAVPMTLYGMNLQGVKGLAFHYLGHATGMGRNDKSVDTAITATNIQVNGAGTQVTATVAIDAKAAVGLRVVTLITDHGEVMGPMTSTLFAVTAKQ